MKTYGGSGGIAPPFFTSALDRGEWLTSSPGCFTPWGTKPGIEEIREIIKTNAYCHD
jgi:hypothetical protein